MMDEVDGPAPIGVGCLAHGFEVSTTPSGAGVARRLSAKIIKLASL